MAQPLYLSTMVLTYIIGSKNHFSAFNSTFDLITFYASSLSFCVSYILMFRPESTKMGYHNIIQFLSTIMFAVQN